MSAGEGVYIPGIEAPLPPGERLLWHGRPSGAAVARHVFHVRTLAAYFAALVCVRLVYGGGSGAAEAVGIAAFVGLAALALALFALVSVWVARSTVYAITDRRVVLKIGMAMPMTLSIPFAHIESAGLREWRDGTGEIALTLTGTDKFAYFMLWPHARPWRLTRPEPSLRGLESPREVSALLAGAVAAAGGEPIVSRMAADAGAPGIALRPPTAVAGD
jgi:hypothetical protein